MAIVLCMMTNAEEIPNEESDLLMSMDSNSYVSVERDDPDAPLNRFARQRNVVRIRRPGFGAGVAVGALAARPYGRYPYYAPYPYYPPYPYYGYPTPYYG